MSVKVVPVLLFFLALIPSSYSTTADEPVPVPRPCFDAFDVVQIQSAPPSLSRWSNLVKDVANITKLIEDLGSDSYFGFATFGDKNISGLNPRTNDFHVLGLKTDDCLHVGLPLGEPNTEMMAKHFEGFQKKAAAGRRGDWFDGIFEGVYRTVIAPGLNWRPKLWNGKKIQRVVVVFVDTVSHLEGDVLKLTGKTVRPFDITENGMKMEGKTENYDCNKVDYPSVEQLANLLNELEIALVMVVSPGGSYDAQRNFTPFEGLASMGEKYRVESGLRLWYIDQLRQAKVRDFHVRSMDSEWHSTGAFYRELYTQLDGFRCPVPVLPNS